MYVLIESMKCRKKSIKNTKAFRRKKKEFRETRDICISTTAKWIYEYILRPQLSMDLNYNAIRAHYFDEINLVRKTLDV